MSTAPSGLPQGVTPYLISSDAEALIAFIQTAFEAEELLLMRQSDGKVGHAEFNVNGGLLMLSQASAEYPAMPCMLHLYIPEVDSVFARAIAAGGKALREPADMPYGDRTGGLLDPCGNQWWLATRLEDLSVQEMDARMKAAGH